MHLAEVISQNAVSQKMGVRGTYLNAILKFIGIIKVEQLLGREFVHFHITIGTIMLNQLYTTFVDFYRPLCHMERTQFHVR